MKVTQWVGVFASLILIFSCFIPWTYYPDLHKHFTGFYSEQNTYGRPGKLFILFSIIAIVLFIIPKIWAKRANWLICALVVAYALKVFVLFTSCYKGICPTKETGIYLVEISAILMLVTALSSELRIRSSK